MEESRTSELLDAVKSMDCDALFRILEGHRRKPKFSELDLNKALLAGVKTGHAEIVRLLLRQRSINVMYSDKHGRRPIHYAAEVGAPSVVDQVINAGSAINAVDEKGLTALHYAARSGNDFAVQILLKGGAHPNRPKTYVSGETPLHLAAKSGKSKVVQLLLLAKANVNAATDDDQSTALHKAVSGRHYDVAKLLVKGGVDIDKQDSRGKSALHLAAEVGLTEVVHLLLNQYADPLLQDQKGKTPLHYAVLIGQIRNIEILLESDRNHFNIAAKDIEGNTPLHLAATTGNVEVGTMLVSAGANLDSIQDHEWTTPLNLAISYGRLDIARMFIYMGADVNLSDKGLCTPLHRILSSRAKGKEEIAKLLVDHGAHVNAMTIQGYTPIDRCVFQYSIGNYSREILVLLVVSGAHLHPIVGHGGLQHNSPLCWLVWRGELESARFLVNVGWNIQQENWINLPGKNQSQTSFLLWLQELVHQPRSLNALCRLSIRSSLNLASKDKEIVTAIEKLPLPKQLKKFLLFQDEIKDLI